MRTYGYYNQFSKRNGCFCRTDVYNNSRRMRIPHLLDLYNFPDPPVPYTGNTVFFLSNLVVYYVFSGICGIFAYFSQKKQVLCSTAEYIKESRRGEASPAFYSSSLSVKSSLDKGFASAAIFNSVFSIWV